MIEDRDLSLRRAYECAHFLRSGRIIRLSRAVLVLTLLTFLRPGRRIFFFFTMIRPSLLP